MRQLKHISTGVKLVAVACVLALLGASIFCVYALLAVLGLL